MERRRIVLLGATGYTGQRVLGNCSHRGEEPTLVGRNRTTMLTLADRLGAELPVAEVDLTPHPASHGSARARGKAIGGAVVTDDAMLGMALHLRKQNLSLRHIAGWSSPRA